MSVTINIPAILQNLTHNKKSIKTTGSSIAEIINTIEAEYPGFRDRVIADGKVHRFMNIYVNDDDIRFLNNLDTKVSSSDSITILPAVAGG